MIFIDRGAELDRLRRLSRRAEAALAVVTGRRRIGKTRLLLEWISGTEGCYSVADQSSADIQRRYFAETVSARLPGFSDVAYPDWRALLNRLSADARSRRWRGPVILDELPYLVSSSPELPSVLQRWIDHEAREARLVVVLAGSSQRMMQGLVMSHDAPLYGRAQEILDLRPIEPRFLSDAFPAAGLTELIEHYASWGGVPRYWELAVDETGSPSSRIERLVLDPLGPLHREPDRLLIEEIPSALEVRPVLDAIGAGAHRVSEIAGRVGRPATSLSRPLDRLVEMGLVRRELPFGEPARSRRSLYRIDDPFFRLWFRVVAPHRGLLATSSRRDRLGLLKRFWPELTAFAWEELCRTAISRLPSSSVLGRRGPFAPAARWWRRTEPEWDIVSESLDARHLLLGEAKWTTRPLSRRTLQRAVATVRARPAPEPGKTHAGRTEIRALFVPALVDESLTTLDDVLVLTARDIFTTPD